MVKGNTFKIRIDHELGKLFDFIIALESGYNYNKQANNSILLDKNLIPDPLVEKFYSKVWDSVDKSVLGVSLFFKKKENDKSYCAYNYLKELYLIRDIDTFINEFLKKNHKVSLLSFYSDNLKENNFYENLLADYKDLIEFVQSLFIDDKLKWDLIAYCTSENIVNESLKEIFIVIRDRINLLHMENSLLISDFESKIIQKNNKSKNGFFINEEFPKMRIEINSSSEYVISISILNEIAKIVYPKNLILGMNYSKLINNDNFEDDLKALFEDIKVLSDVNRINILNEIRDKEINAGELAKAINLANSTTSYHLDLLSNKKFIVKRKHGKNIAYIANKDSILEFIEKLQDLLI